MADAEIEALRDQLYALAEVAVGVFETATEASRKAFANMAADARDEALERASILEFDGGRPRALAAQAAFDAHRTSPRGR